MTTKSKTGLVISAGTTLEEARRVGEEVRKRGLQILSVYGGDIPVHQSLRAAIDALRKLIDNSAEAGAQTLMMGGHRQTRAVRVLLQSHRGMLRLRSRKRGWDYFEAS